MIDPNIETTRQVIDGAVGLGAVTWPVWVQHLETTGYIVTLVGGLLLLGLRIAIALHEWRNRKRG